jgi:hypothetical protein
MGPSMGPFSKESVNLITAIANQPNHHGQTIGQLYSSISILLFDFIG